MPYMTAGQEWPWPGCPGPRAAAAYDGGTESIARSRAFTAAFLDRALSDHAVHVAARARADAQLVVSELVTNACKYAPGPYALALEIRGRFLEIALRDGDPAPPAVAPATGPATAGRVGGHGLEIVLAVCASFEVRCEAAGKCVVARLPLDGE